MLEVFISHFIDALTEEKTKVPRRFDLSKVQVGSPLYDIAREATEEITGSSVNCINFTSE